jgi:dTMP kinase
MAARWRPMPDLTILITDDIATAAARAEYRDHRRYTPEEAALHHRVATLYDRLATDDPSTHRIDRRVHDIDKAVQLMQEWIHAPR